MIKIGMQATVTAANHYVPAGSTGIILALSSLDEVAVDFPIFAGIYWLQPHQFAAFGLPTGVKPVDVVSKHYLEAADIPQSPAIELEDYL